MYLLRPIHIEGIKLIPHGGPVVFLGNHKDAIDPVVFLKVMAEHPEFPRVTIVGKQELKFNRFIAPGMDLIDCLYINRADIRSFIQLFEDEAIALKSGRSLLIYIEGTYTHQHEFLEYKSAITKIAYKCNVPIVPVVFHGTMGIID
jgi:1-acyl-sn-glycerol-3-phosphate acyltransferase